MRPVSAAWGRTIVGTHRAIYRATVCTTFQTGTTPTGTRIPILGGDVVLDGTAAVRSTLDLVTAGTDSAGALLWPARSDSLLVPYGNEIYIERGIRYTDALVEYVGLGYFRINRTGQDKPPDGPIRVSGKDRMGLIIKARLVTPQQFLVGVTVGSVVAALVQQVYPSAAIEWDDNTDDIVLTRSLIADDDRFLFLDRLLRSYGKIWYWDHRGILVVKALPSTTQPVWDIHSGPGGVLVRVARELSDDEVFNGIVASGEAIDTYDPPRSFAIDNNPQSPTYYYGRFGPVPGYLTDAAIQTQGQAAAAAEAELRRRIGVPHVMDLSAVPNAALEPYDPVSVRLSREGRRTHVLDRLTIPISDGPPMTAVTREQTDVVISVST